MPNIEFIHPLQQPVGTFRLLDWLKESFQSDDYHQFRCLTAFAKVMPFYKLHSSIQVWNAKGNHSEAVIGIDHMGTSYQALQYALMNFHAVRILHTELATFHPKLYLFYGEKKCCCENKGKYVPQKFGNATSMRGAGQMYFYFLLFFRLSPI